MFRELIEYLRVTREREKEMVNDSKLYSFDKMPEDHLVIYSEEKKLWYFIPRKQITIHQINQLVGGK